MNTESEKEALLEAINIVGSQAALARKLGIKQQSVAFWLKKGLPVKRVIEIEMITRRKVSRYKLKPSFFHPEL
jgi:DNA-binding transcriptional regulator YdaS (Cro superfamily)